MRAYITMKIFIMESIFCLYVLCALFPTKFLVFLNASPTKPTLCLDYGFNPEKLSCLVCQQSIANFFTEQHNLFETCMKCCTDETMGSFEESFSKAVLLVDKTALKFLPDIEFIVKNKKKYNLSVKYRYGPPQLALYQDKDDDDPVDYISIHNWDKATIIEYLASHIDTSSIGTKKKGKKRSNLF